jgi:hypothetical protein
MMKRSRGESMTRAQKQFLDVVDALAARLCAAPRSALIAFGRLKWIDRCVTGAAILNSEWRLVH